jgi:hypothetical protein
MEHIIIAKQPIDSDWLSRLCSESPSSNGAATIDFPTYKARRQSVGNATVSAISYCFGGSVCCLLPHVWWHVIALAVSQLSLTGTRHSPIFCVFGSRITLPYCTPEAPEVNRSSAAALDVPQ